jgi:RNA polymerase sigma-70 factor, ECF subfamily
VAQNRNVNCEVTVGYGWWNSTSSDMITEFLAASLTTPSEAACRRENLEKVRATLEGMEQVDREIITLCHFEGLTMSEIAELVGLKAANARTRYYRSLKKLQQQLCADSTVEAAFPG